MEMGMGTQQHWSGNGYLAESQNHFHELVK